MTHQSTRRGVERPKAASKGHPSRTRLVSALGRQIDDIYGQLDTALTRMAQIQLQFDELRSKIRLL